MTKLDEEFFKDKRPWSKIKDEVLGKYMKPYLAKVNTLRKNILLIDTFAGPGVFEDGSSGSPLLMIERAQEMVPENYQAIFVNKYPAHHKSIKNLFGASSSFGDLIEQKKVIPRYDDAKIILKDIIKLLGDQTVFLYIDPYALKGCEFDTWLPFLNREQKSSTEILVNINITAVRRLASRNSILRGEINDKIIGFHKRLDEVFGGNYWKESLLNPNLEQKDAEEELMRTFKKKILKYVKYVGYCPVKVKPNNLAKFYIMYLSNSEDGLLLMNDIMCKAYNTRMINSITKDLPLFPNLKIKWNEKSNLIELKHIILTLIKSNSKKSRKEYWKLICIDFFMRYIESEFKAVIKKLHHDRQLLFEDVKGTKRLNNDSLLYLPDYKSI